MYIMQPKLDPARKVIKYYLGFLKKHTYTEPSIVQQVSF